jgi:hypothetical protein
MASIGFGAGEAIEVHLPLSVLRDMLQKALAEGSLVELEDPRGEKIVINPQQVKILQDSDTPEPFPADGNGHVRAAG